jgi:2-polyprenyl-3-methyl-5-hydroxy-6-metoxy-1,4-benzoquinol methylase
MLASIACALCGGTSYRLVADMGWRRALRCADCGMIRADPLPSPEEKVHSESFDYENDDACPEVQDLFKNYHRDYVEDPIIRRMRTHLADLEETIGGPANLLDVGSGTGIFMHLARERGWRPAGVELCAERAKECEREFELPVHVGLFEDINFDGQAFDAISMLDVVEHTLNPLAMMRRAHALLRPGGAVFVAVPNGQCLLTVLLHAYGRMHGPRAAKLLSRMYVPIHLHYFTPRTLTRLATSAGFRVRRLVHAPAYLGRYTMPLWMSLPLKTILAVGALMHMDARLEIVAVKT